MKFFYQALDETSTLRTGHERGENADEVRRLLELQGWTVVEIHPASETDSSRTTALETPSGATSPIVLPSLTMLTNLRALSEELSTSALRSAVAELADRIEQGERPIVAFEIVKDRLSPDLRSLLWLGLQNGRLDVLLANHLNHVRRMFDVQSSLWTGLAYPLFLMAFFLTFILVCACLIVPLFGQLFRDFGVQLPALTVLILDFSDFLRQALYPLLLVILFGLPIIWGVLRIVLGLAGTQRVFRAIPLIGHAYQYSSMASCAETLSTLISMQLPLPQALRMAAEGSDDLNLAYSLKILAQQMESGDLAPPVHPGIPEFAQLRLLADQPDLLLNTLHSTREISILRCRISLQMTRGIVEPLLVFGVALLVGIMFVGLFMPLTKLLNDLS